MGVAAFVLAALACLVAVAVWAQYRRLRRAEYIRAYVFPRGLFDRLSQRRPELARKDIALVARGLRHFFLAHLKSGRRFVSMPSQVADDLWHEFILYTKNYEAFCREAFGRFLHHSPAAVLAPERKESNAGLRRVWWHCCKEENIDARNPTRLPLLFALDAKLGIAGGFVYAADCAALKAGATGAVYCGGDFASASIDGGTDGFGDGAAAGGGDGGASDGGGCGGGGD
ncbi:MAG: hypothetical protein JNM90_24825 [Burkholderiales bacterium]|nr:hypothetical protein [Burkholderiales bacterium]